jgi:hypothetical protein
MAKPKNFLKISCYGLKLSAHGTVAIIAHHLLLIFVVAALIGIIAFWPDNTAKLISSLDTIQQQTLNNDHVKN